MFSQPQLDHILQQLASLGPESFHDLIVDHLRGRSTQFADVERGPAGADRNVDIKARGYSPTGDTFEIIFQCKHWNRPIGQDVVNELIAALTERSAGEAVLVALHSPSQPARDRIELLREHGNRIVWHGWCGRDLAETLITKTPHILFSYLPALVTAFPELNAIPECPSFEVVGGTAPTGIIANASRFFEGYPPTWSDIASDRDIPREVYRRPSVGIRARILDLLGSNRPEVRILPIIGVGGTGKTTILRRLAFDTATAGYRVLRLRQDWQEIGVGLTSQIAGAAGHAPGGLLIIVDDCAQLIDVQNAFPALQEISPKGAVILAITEQPDQWNRVKRRLPGILPEREQYVHRLLDQECEALVDRILQLESEGVIPPRTPLSRAERLDLCIDRADRHLVVAMLQMRHGLPFHAIIKREYDRIPTDRSRLAYGAVCYLNTFDLGVPREALCRAFELTSAMTREHFLEDTEGLLVDSGLGLAARHRTIATAVARHAFQSSEARQGILVDLLSVVDYKQDLEERFVITLFTERGSQRRLLRDLGKSPQLVRGLYQRSEEAWSEWPPDLMKHILASRGVAERVLGDRDAARSYLKRSLEHDPMFTFALRQLAWLEHVSGNWRDAAARAIDAAKNSPKHAPTMYQVGTILEFNTVANFRRARPYLSKAVELAPASPKYSKSLEKYDDAAKVLSFLGGLRDDEVIPPTLFRELRPRIMFLRTVYGSRNKRVTQQLKRELETMREQVSGTLDDLDEVVAGTDIERSRPLQALVTCNVARLRYLDWYRRREPCDTDELEVIFRKSLELNEEDPFTHCWYGTFLKEMRSDFPAARREYDLAFTFGNKSTNQRFHDHPLFLNNQALLIMDEVRLGIKESDALRDAEAILERAMAKLEDGSDFPWPPVSLSLCRQLMTEKGIQVATL